MERAVREMMWVGGALKGAFNRKAWADGTGRLTRTGWTVVAAITLLALVARLIRLDHRGLWLDELHTLKPVVRPVGELIRERLQSGHLPTYFLGLKGWTALFGTSDISLRLPSVVAGTLVIPVAAWAANGRVRAGMLLAALGLIAANGVAVDASQTARMYSILTLAATAAFGLHLRALEAGSAGAPRGRVAALWGAWGATVLAGASVQALMFLFAGGQVIAQAFRPGATRRQVRGTLLLIAFLAVTATGGALSTNFFNRKLGGIQIASVHPGTLIEAASTLTFGEHAPWKPYKPTRNGALLLIAGLVGLTRLRRPSEPSVEPSSPGEQSFLRMCAFSAAVPFALFFALALLFDQASGAKRYLAPLIVPFAFLLAGGIGRLPRPGRRFAWAAVALLVALGLLGRWKTGDSGARNLLAYIAKHAEPGDVVVANQFGAAYTAIDHYLAPAVARHPIPVPFFEEDRPQEVIFHELQQIAASPEFRRIWVYTYRERQKRIREVVRLHPELFQLEKQKKVDRGEAFLYRIVGK